MISKHNSNKVHIDLASFFLGIALQFPPELQGEIVIHIIVIPVVFPLLCYFFTFFFVFPFYLVDVHKKQKNQRRCIKDGILWKGSKMSMIN
ncbi:hypothetical protein CDL12_18973 [Handroanthus impetiginosus]|uniref:Uncharacterized protein n=1 Tax=Handroanthus impetiginosus TaxID=429701 RepID=A0A2G9GT34_9LAMI|nr:hypothetical protein CDL12_18973 [Handroanthus impetiginosus]